MGVRPLLECSYSKVANLVYCEDSPLLNLSLWFVYIHSMSYLRACVICSLRTEEGSDVVSDLCVSAERLHSHAVSVLRLPLQPPQVLGQWTSPLYSQLLKPNLHIHVYIPLFYHIVCTIILSSMTRCTRFSRAWLNFFTLTFRALEITLRLVIILYVA